MAEKKEKRQTRFSYLNDYIMSASGEYIYTGRMWEYKGDLPFNKAKGSLSLLNLIIIAVSLSSGLIATPGASFVLYIVIPYVLELVLSLIVMYKLYTLFKDGPVVKDYEYKKSGAQLPAYYYGIMIGSVASFIGEAAYLMFNGFHGKVFLGILYLVSRLVCGFVAYKAAKKSKELNYQIIN
ncbi:MAG: hypothetical protein MJ171_05885 [Clostridia bacterium]|nr:hypothetical protein [Clostridia bacterium]